MFLIPSEILTGHACKYHLSDIADTLARYYQDTIKILYQEHRASPVVGVVHVVAHRVPAAITWAAVTPHGAAGRCACLCWRVVNLVTAPAAAVGEGVVQACVQDRKDCNRGQGPQPVVEDRQGLGVCRTAQDESKPALQLHNVDI
jgi:hypothetical protein